MAVAFIGLGSNLGDREANLKNAARLLGALESVTILKQSSILETDPVDYLDQPRFLNQIIKIATDLAPHDLLAALAKTETDLGRKKSFPKGPRLIDLDLLLYDDCILDTATLVIPHPRITNRRFVMQHLVELDPYLVDPLSGKKYDDILSHTNTW
jgi:2-amino-4-hydroxy-6-hydroxymethyldihydropteridine diphosphokinase